MSEHARITAAFLGRPAAPPATRPLAIGTLIAAAVAAAEIGRSLWT